MAEKMMDFAETYGWNVKLLSVLDHDALTQTLKTSAVKNLLLYCEYQENAMEVVRLVGTLSYFLSKCCLFHNCHAIYQY